MDGWGRWRTTCLLLLLLLLREYARRCLSRVCEVSCLGERGALYGCLQVNVDSTSIGRCYDGCKIRWGPPSVLGIGCRFLAKHGTMGG